MGPISPNRIHAIFTPGLIAGLSSLLPPILAGFWKLASPGYHCNIRNPAAVGDSPCFAISFGLAYGLGWLVGLITRRVADRLAPGEAAAERLRRVRAIGSLVAGLLGVVVGIPAAVFVLNPCP